MKRQRGRGRKPGNPANRTFESNGPEVKIRGNASQIYDKYLQLARDASSSGDRVRAENLYQHAEHYYRIVQARQPKRDPAAEEGEENTEATGDNAEGEEQAPRENRRGRRGRRNSEHGGDNSADNSGDNSGDRAASEADPLNVVTPEGDAAKSDAGEDEAGDREEAEAPRRRTRRPRRPRAEKTDAAEASDTASEASADSASGGDEKSDSESEAA